ncbi:EAL domain-containing protein [Vibrio diabolicus]|uniref:EAL domain-containing protein n=1 Tax=Vibrio diabolicus TaxID=50719 RepID=UPI0015F4D7D4|nr:EAL domain-containing protein [Vibrio diabolicus]
METSPFLIDSEILNQKIKNQLEVDLKRSPQNFVVHYQPIFRVSDTDKPWGYEALSRWISPYNIPPSIFIPILESDAKLLSKFTMLVTQKVIEDIKIWMRLQSEVLHVTLNLSFNVLNEPEYTEQLRKIIFCYPDVADILFLEITESHEIELTDVFINSIESLSCLGVRFALDDFGAGYADIRSLTLPFWSIVKIDKLLTEKIINSNSELNAFTEVAEFFFPSHSYLVFEGVELEQQHLFLKGTFESQVLSQGFFYAKPMLSDDIVKRFFTRR